MPYWENAQIPAFILFWVLPKLHLVSSIEHFAVLDNIDIDTIHHEKMVVHHKFTFGLIIWKPKNKSHAVICLPCFSAYWILSHSANEPDLNYTFCFSAFNVYVSITRIYNFLKKSFFLVCVPQAQIVIYWFVETLALHTGVKQEGAQNSWGWFTSSAY